MVEDMREAIRIIPPIQLIPIIPEADIRVMVVVALALVSY